MLIGNSPADIKLAGSIHSYKTFSYIVTGYCGALRMKRKKMSNYM